MPLSKNANSTQGQGSPAEHLALAKSAMDFTLQKITFSSNRGAQNSDKSEQLKQMRDEAEKIKDPIFSFAWIKQTAELALRYGVGNCNEKACIAFMYLVAECASSKIKPRIELFSNPFFDHVFVVLGRPEDSKESDQKSWIGATICDPLAEETYSIDAENLASLQAKKTSMLFAEESPVKTVISISDEHDLEKTIHIAGTLEQNKIVLRQQVNYDNKQQGYIEMDRPNKSVPITYDPGIDYAPGKKERHYSTGVKEAYREQLQENKKNITKKLEKAGLFNSPRENQTPDEVSQQSKELIKLIKKFLYK